MAAMAASGIFPASSCSPNSSIKASKTTFGDNPNSLNVQGISAKPNSSSKSVDFKTHAQALPKINGTKTKIEGEAPSVSSNAPKTFYNQLPDWSMLLAAITTIFLAAEKQWTLLDWKPRRPDMITDAFGLGRIVQDGFVFKQNFPIRSYEIGADKTASIETLMNHLQETSLNHVKRVGLMDDGFGATAEMSKKNLIWVVNKMRVLVEHYPSWGDVVEVDTWVRASGKNGMRRDWRIHDVKTSKTVMKATSVWVMMNKHTRKLAKMPEEVRAEIGPYFIEHKAIVDEDSRKLTKLDDNTADYVKTGLAPRWNDLDVNQHVNNVKYIGWLLESTPVSLLESHELASMSLEYRRECGRDDVLNSLTSVSTNCKNGTPETKVECDHLLRLQCGAEIVRGHTEWRPKSSKIT
ncbi:palmitoyl-acyl carrier protein thioesterase, chloroplastic-like isoform X2 [Asparagus officinalis]|uniref:palmitoyl-acyl carrier protein thioesterase, chloroplastic-like isoform X2 n=1 Tax=Asparagus officinalis TaxID=4686 RepID=UPI00098E733B|nr:palmitoyl-acyl carrier protein thioesterase, chloroplastic-like isoform X2 [Asparagus officinalis]